MFYIGNHQISLCKHLNNVLIPNYWIQEKGRYSLFPNDFPQRKVPARKVPCITGSLKHEVPARKDPDPKNMYGP